MAVDSFKFLPRLITFLYQAIERETLLPIPWTPLPKPLSKCRFALVTTGGLYDASSSVPFDLARERAEPTWGDPGYRQIRRDFQQQNIRVSHLHINPAAPEADINVLLPINRFEELAAAGAIGSVAETHYSFMGFQGYPADTTEWEQTYAPEVVRRLKAEEVDCVLLTPA
jgi:D-proline reductase (dithiol) PrdB